MMPPARVLVGVDFSAPSRTALDFGARLAHQCRAILDVVYVEDPLLAAVARDRGFDLAAQTEAELRKFVDGVRPGTEASCHVGGGATVDGLIHAAAHTRADVIVVGAHGMSGTTRLVFGSTTERLLRQSHCSVFVVPDRWARTLDTRDLSGIGPVVCGVDPSLPAIDAATAGARLAACLRTSVSLLHVVPPLRVIERWQAHADEAMERQVAAIQHELERATAQLGSIAPCTLKVEIGNVPERLAAAAAAQPHCLLVLGRALRGMHPSPPGSNASRVLALVDVPVLMHVTKE